MCSDRDFGFSDPCGNRTLREREARCAVVDVGGNYRASSGQVGRRCTSRDDKQGAR